MNLILGTVTGLQPGQARLAPLFAIFKAPAKIEHSAIILYAISMSCLPIRYL